MSDNAHYLITACYQNINNVKYVPASNREIANLDGMSFSLPVIIVAPEHREAWGRQRVVMFWKGRMVVLSVVSQAEISSSRHLFPFLLTHNTIIIYNIIVLFFSKFPKFSFTAFFFKWLFRPLCVRMSQLCQLHLLH